MTRVLLVTNDFPPTVGGIQSYLREFVSTQISGAHPSHVVVLTSTQDAAAAQAYDAQQSFPIVRLPQRTLLPTPRVAVAMSELIRRHDIDTVWFGAAAPLGLLARAARRAGARRVVASTHGHEVGWSMLPGARWMLREIANHCDAITYISEYTLRRLRRPLGTHPELVHLPGGVDTQVFRRQQGAPVPPAVASLPGGEKLQDSQHIVVCMSRLVARKGQDSLISAWPEVQRAFPDAVLVIAGEGPYEAVLRKKAAGQESIVFTGRLNQEDALAVLSRAQLFAMPARTRGWGLDVEGLGIVYLEAQSLELPVVAGTSGGAPETVTADTGVVVDGRDLTALTGTLIELLGDAPRRAQMGQAGRRHVLSQWDWEILGERLRAVLRG